MTIDPNDPKLTAYVLGELDETEHAEVEAAISQSTELRRAVDEIRGTTDLLANELVGEPSISLLADQRTAIEMQPGKPRFRGRLGRVRRARWFAPIGAGASIAAVLAIAFSLGQGRYGDLGRAVRHQASGRRSASLRKLRTNMASVATSSRVYSADANGWGTPVHPSQYSVNPSQHVGAYEWSGDGPPSAGKRAPDGLVVYYDDAVGSVIIEGRFGVFDKNGEVFLRNEGVSRSSEDEESDDEGTYAFSEDEPPGGRTLQASKIERAARTPHAASSNAKIIKTGNLTLEVDVYALAVDRMRAIAKEHGAVVADASTSEQTGGALSGRLVIRVSPDRFEPLFKALKSVGQVEAENVKAADVTANYVDLESRIASLKITQARLAELVTNKSFVDKMSALLEVEREMTRVRTQLEQLMGQLRVMADRVALSTITVSLHEAARIVPSVSLSIEVPVLKDAAAKLGEALARVDGRLTFGRTSKQDAGTLRGDYRLRVKLSHFADLLAGLESLGRVEQRQVNDRQFGDSRAPWAQKVHCDLTLVLYERSRQLPSGSISIEVDDLAPALDQLDKLLVGDVGSIVSNHSTRRGDGSSVAELRLQISAGRFAHVAGAVTSLGRITAKSVSGEAGRIVGGAANVPCELSLTLAERIHEVPSGHVVLEVDEFQSSREQLSDLVADRGVQVLASSSNQRTDGSWIGNFRLGIRAGEMDTVLTRMESLGRIVSRQINGLGLGDLSRIDPSTIGVINLTLAEKTAINPGPQRTGDSLRNRLRDGLAGLYTSLGFIAYGLIVMAPWLIIVVLFVWVVMRVRRRRALRNADG